MHDFPSDEQQFQKQWSSKGGECAALGRVQVMLEQLSAEAFVRRRDEVANVLRDAAQKVSEQRKEAAAALDSYIKEAQKREYERRPKH